MKLFILAVVICMVGILHAAVKSPYKKISDIDDRSGETGTCEASCIKEQHQEIEALKHNITSLVNAIQDFRSLLADHTNHHDHHQRGAGQSHHQDYNQGQNKNLISTVVTGVQKPLIGVTETLTSDYFPFPENAHRPAEHHQPDNSGFYDQQRPGMTHGAHSHTHTRGEQGGCGEVRFPAAFMGAPKIRNPEDFDIGVCHVRPNSALSQAERGNVFGVIVLKQKKNSPTLSMVIRLTGFNISAHHHESHHEDLHETQQIQQKPFVEKFTQESIKNIPFRQETQTTSQQQIDPSHQHGFHVHEKADLSNGCESAGAHYNPYRMRHGGPKSVIRHVGDFGNINCDDDGNTNLIITDEVASLRGQYSIIGKPLVIHANYDDLGSKTTDPGSSTTGNAGPRLACCIIERIPSSLYNEGAWAKTGSKNQKSVQEPTSQHEEINQEQHHHH